MESANHSHLQDHQLNADDHHSSSSNSLATSSTWYGTATNNHPWTPSTITTLNTRNNHLYQNLNEDPYIPTVYSSHNKEDMSSPPSSSHPLICDVSYNWSTTSSNNNVESLQLSKTENLEIQHSFPKFTDMLMNISSSNMQDLQLHEQQNDWNDDLSDKLLLKTLSSSSSFLTARGQYQFPALEFPSDAQNCINYGGGVSIPSRMNFSPVLQSVNVSSLNQSSSGSLDMNLQALDFLASARFRGTSVQSSHDNLGLQDERHSFTQQHTTQHQKYRPPSSPSQVLSPFVNGATDEKRSSNIMTEPKESQSAPKKSRLEPICRKPLKVRKEKLGDRITALQQLVAPFGKTDTASVLMEAIGYIKFLQNQVETLSVPYMKKSHCNRASTRSSSLVGRTVIDEEGIEAGNRDLLSRGLCLVPLSCLSYVNTDGFGEGARPPNDYGG